MLLIDTYVDKSEIEGVGVFTAQPIKAGTLIWKLDPDFDRLINLNFLQKSPDHLREFFVRYAYPLDTDPDTLILEVDNGRFMNHHETPNTQYKEIVRGYAIRDIEIGEELTCNYAEFDPGYRLMPSYSLNTANAAMARENGVMLKSAI